MEKCVPKYGLHCWADGNLLDFSLTTWSGRIPVAVGRRGSPLWEDMVRRLLSTFYLKWYSQKLYLKWSLKLFFSHRQLLHNHPCWTRIWWSTDLQNLAWFRNPCHQSRCRPRNCRRLCDPKRLLVFSMAIRIRTADQWSQGFITNYLFMFEFDSVKILQVKGATCGGLTWQHGYAWKLCEIPADKVKVPELAGSSRLFLLGMALRLCVMNFLGMPWRHDETWHLNIK